jgi:hypothetical protein
MRLEKSITAHPGGRSLQANTRHIKPPIGNRKLKSKLKIKKLKIDHSYGEFHTTNYFHSAKRGKVSDMKKDYLLAIGLVETLGCKKPSQ